MTVPGRVPRADAGRLVRSAVVAQLARCDDATWAALASPGLVRRARKDLLLTQPELAHDDADDHQGAGVVRIQVGPQVVTFDPRGPAAASCTCPSRTTCRHVVSAGLWLASESAPPASGDVQAELANLTVDVLIEHVGRQAYRWAAQFVDGLDPSDVRIEVDHQVRITLRRPYVTFRYVGGELAGLIPDVRLPQPERYAVAAVLAYHRLRGIQPSAPEPTVSTRPRVTEAAAERTENRRRLREAVVQLLEDTVRLGLAHLSPAMYERYETVAVWAQGAEYPRLAQQLRRLADHVELMLRRSARADERRLLDDTALTYALVSALESTSQTGDAPAHLVGQARQRYDTMARMDLYGLGSVPWRSASGYLGLTTVLWWPEGSRFVSVTDARPESLRGFDPRARYRSPGPWTGLDSPAAATGARVCLSNARLSAAGRLSAVERTGASVVPLDGAELVDVLPVLASWTDVEAALRRGLSLLDPPNPLRDWVVVRPARFEPATFEPIGQRLTWILRDAEGAALSLVMSYTRETAHAIDRMERLDATDLPTGTLVVCRCWLTPRGLVGEPLSLVRPDLPAGNRPVDCLHFDPPRRTGVRKSRTLAGASAMAVPPDAGSETASADEAGSQIPRQLTDVRTWLVHQAERGTGAQSPAEITAGLRAHHQALRDIGLDVFPTEIPDDPARALLRSHFLTLQTTQLFGGL